MIKNIIFKTLLLSLIFFTGLSKAAEETYYDFNIWSSTGQTKWQHDASMLNPEYGAPTSVLDYRDLVSQIAEVRAYKTLTSGDHLQLSIGAGYINSGLLIDDDYYSAYGASQNNTTVSGAHRFSRTHSDIEGNGLFFLKGEFLPKQMAYQGSRLDVQLGFGLHYWMEEYKAVGVRYLEYTVPTSLSNLCPPLGTRTTGCEGVTAITNTVQWTGLGIGGNFQFLLMDSLVAKLDLTYYPIMNLLNEDIHHLRTTGEGALAQDPSIRMSGTGTGYDLQASLNLQIDKSFSAHLGYRLWEREVLNQRITFYGASGGSSTANLMDFSTRREGFYGGISLSFD